MSIGRGDSRAVDAARSRIDQGRVGGLGIKLMLRCTDRLEYNDVGNMITLTKFHRTDKSKLESSTVSGQTSS